VFATGGSRNLPSVSDSTQRIARVASHENSPDVRSHGKSGAASGSRPLPTDRPATFVSGSPAWRAARSHLFPIRGNSRPFAEWFLALGTKSARPRTQSQCWQTRARHQFPALAGLLDPRHPRQLVSWRRIGERSSRTRQLIQPKSRANRAIMPCSRTKSRSTAAC
jgi:hypothetical protein